MAPRMCTNCANFNLRRAFSVETSGPVTCESQPYQEWKWINPPDEHCPLCQFILECAVLSNNDSWRERRVAASATTHTGCHVSLKFVMGHDFITVGCVSDVEFGQRIVRSIEPVLSNMSGIKPSIDACRRYHKCASLDLWEDIELAGFRLIDCVEQKIVEVKKKCRFVALSYVWGGWKVQDNPFPADIPRTIQDAMSVTQMLGFRYLWVDAYCIEQGHKEHLEQQLSQMDLIYTKAEITIIAAAGRNPQHGLPGISVKRSSWQPQAKIDDIELIAVNNRPWEGVRYSTWSNRKWTFQEGYCSKRRLFFTERQVIFDCNESQAYESTAPAFSPAIASTQRPSYSWNREIEWVQIYALIEEYSRRQLSLDTDALRAFTAVLRRFERSSPSVAHLWGIPIPTEDELSLNSFLLGLTWRHNAGFSEADGPKVLPGFPTWSWCSWSGPVTYPYGKHFIPWVAPTIKVSLEAGSGEIIDWNDYVKTLWNSAGPLLRLSPYIHLHTFFFELEVPRSRDAMFIPNKDSWLAMLRCEYRGDSQINGFDVGERHTAIFLGTVGSRSSQDLCFFMLVSKASDYWKRENLIYYRSQDFMITPREYLIKDVSKKLEQKTFRLG